MSDETEKLYPKLKESINIYKELTYRMNLEISSTSYFFGK